jgi:hypothetical protein
MRRAAGLRGSQETWADAELGPDGEAQAQVDGFRACAAGRRPGRDSWAPLSNLFPSARPIIVAFTRTSLALAILLRTAVYATGMHELV